MNPLYSSVAARAFHRCEYCRAPEAVFNFTFEVEHVQPTTLGGASEEGNLALACRACNLRKGARTSARDPLTGQITRLFHPREDRWEEHFDIDMDAAEVTALTAVGRATIAQLQLNSEDQKSGRRQWRRLGLFP